MLVYEFVSISAEAEEIVHFFETKNIDTIDVLCEFSLGGKIAHEIWKGSKLNIHNLIMDGAPLVACPQFAIKIMIKNYKNIIHKSKIRDSKVIENFKINFERKGNFCNEGCRKERSFSKGSLKTLVEKGRF